MIEIVPKIKKRTPSPRSLTARTLYILAMSGTMFWAAFYLLVALIIYLAGYAHSTTIGGAPNSTYDRVSGLIFLLAAFAQLIVLMSFFQRSTSKKAWLVAVLAAIPMVLFFSDWGWQIVYGGFPMNVNFVILSLISLAYWRTQQSKRIT